VVQDVSEMNALQMIRPGDMVLCRVNAPLLSVCFELIRRGIGATVLGRDIGAQVTKALDGVAKIEGFSFALFPQFAERYRAIQMNALSRRKDSEGQIIALNDRMDAIQEIYCWATLRGAGDVGALRAEIERLFSDRESVVTLSSIHKAKGLERDRVFLMKPHLLPHPMARTDEAKIQESNLEYVAITRAMRELYIAHEDPSKATQGQKEMEVGING
jgi:DNA helicase II / ATP-dependent DNA helicase PcrA